MYIAAGQTQHFGNMAALRVAGVLRIKPDRAVALRYGLVAWCVKWDCGRTAPCTCVLAYVVAEARIWDISCVAPMAKHFITPKEHTPAPKARRHPRALRDPVTR